MNLFLKLFGIKHEYQCPSFSLIPITFIIHLPLPLTFNCFNPFLSLENAESQQLSVTKTRPCLYFCTCSSSKSRDWL